LATIINGFWILTFEFGPDTDAKQPIQSSEHHSSAKVSLSRKTTPLIFQSEWSWWGEKEFDDAYSSWIFQLKKKSKLNFGKS